MDNTKTIKHNKRVLLILFFYLVFTGLGIHAQQKKWNAVTHDKTNFPLVGKHRTVACSECHQKGVMKGTPTNCEACHWIRKQDDRYQLQLGIHCQDCHTPYDWEILRPNSWNHEQASGYLLEGAHKALDCYQCHKENIFQKGVSECIDCHQKEYNEASDPNHVAGQFPTDCKACHNMLGWQPSRFNHLGFPLAGTHRTLSCSECHKNGLFAGTPSECVACHLDQYNDTKSPNHKLAGYPTDCQFCHGNNATTWYGAKIDHNQFWPLKGAHRGLDCTACHRQGSNISSDCITCHLDDYNNTTDPDHREAGFYTDCLICHLEESPSWSQVIFDHSFPIFSGKHQHLSCSECHQTTNYYEFTCTDCHTHSKDQMDNKHNEVGGYLYNSQACYSCHPAGIK
jgi:hypothetical protein